MESRDERSSPQDAIASSVANEVRGNTSDASSMHQETDAPRPGNLRRRETTGTTGTAGATIASADGNNSLRRAASESKLEYVKSLIRELRSYSS